MSLLVRFGAPSTTFRFTWQACKGRISLPTFSVRLSNLISTFRVRSAVCAHESRWCACLSASSESSTSSIGSLRRDGQRAPTLNTTTTPLGPRPDRYHSCFQTSPCDERSPCPSRTNRRYQHSRRHLELTRRPTSNKLCATLRTTGSPRTSRTRRRRRRRWYLSWG